MQSQWIIIDTYLTNHLDGESIFQSLAAGLDCYEKVERCAIEGLMRFIKSFTNPEEMRQKINTALLIPYSKMYNQNWAGTDWDWFTGQLKKNERDGWSFTDEERESIRISRETSRNMVEASRREQLTCTDNVIDGDIVNK